MQRLHSIVGVVRDIYFLSYLYFLSNEPILSQYGGPDGEIGASMRYLSQRFTMPNRMAAAVLNDIGTEELAHRGYQ